MPYIPPEVVEKAKQIDLLSYLQSYEPDELVKVSNGIYCTKTHDSLRISNGMWMWFSRGFGGRSALDYLIKVKGYDFYEAVKTLSNGDITLVKANAKQDNTPKILLLPEKSKSNKRVFRYLTKERGIDGSIVAYCLNHNLIYESLPYHNIVFVGYDDENKPRYGAFRSPNSERFMGDCSGSDKAYPFGLKCNNSNAIHLFESAIDLLSFATLLKMKGKNWQEYNLLSLAGVYMPKDKIENSKVPVALERYINANPNINTIYLHLDNDKAGKFASKALQTILPKSIKVIDNPVPIGKDVNDFLLYKKGNPIKFKENKSVFER